MKHKEIHQQMWVILREIKSGPNKIQKLFYSNSFIDSLEEEYKFLLYTILFLLSF